MTERKVIRVRFIEDFYFKPSPQITIAYKAGMERPVAQACAELAIALGRAVMIEDGVTPGKGGRRVARR